MELNLPAICEAIEAKVPERECLVFRGRHWTWAEVGARTRRVASLLASAGLGGRDRGDAAGWESTQDHVALYLYNGNEYLEWMLGAMKGRCAAVNLNYRYGPAELRHVIEDSASRAVVYHGCFGDTLAAALGDHRPELLVRVDDGSGVAPVPESVDYEEALAAASPQLPEGLRESWSPDDLYLCYTGGTTGLPKGVLWRQADFLVSALGIRRRDGSDFESLDELAQAAERGASLRALPAPPLMHGAAHWNAISAWTSGGTVVIQDDPTRLDPADIWRTVERERVTSLLIVGDPFARPLIEEWDSAAAEGRQYDASTLRHLLSGGAVLSPGTKRELLERLDGVVIVDVLGSTESGRQGISRAGSSDDAERGFDSGPTAVVLDERRERVLEPGSDEIGWLAQGGRVPLGYLGDPEKTMATFPVIDGRRWSVAGDRARLDAEGRIVLLGRDSVTINTGGEKVFAEEVETALKEHPSVHDAVVCGRPSERWGEEIVGIVSLRAGAEVAAGAEVGAGAEVEAGDDPAGGAELVEALRAHVRERLAGFKVPKDVLVVDRVERSPSGKADYRWARELAASRVHS